MINGAHLLLYSSQPDADRAFFRDVLNFPFVDVGHRWLIFALPPAELAVHPADGDGKKVHAGHELLNGVLYLMCDDLKSQIQALKTKHISCSELEEAPWGIKTTIILPSGNEVGLYEPRHPTALGLAKRPPSARKRATRGKPKRSNRRKGQPRK